MKAKAAVVAAYKQPLEVREFEVRGPEPGAIVVRIDRATICGTDHHVQQGLLQPVSRTPSVLGHEMVGIVEKLGAGRTADIAGAPLAPGDRIIWAYAYCGKCYYCAVAHQPTLCSNFTPYGYADCAPPPHLLGGFAQYAYVLPQCHVVKVPDGVPSHWASSASCALRTIMHATARAGGIRPAETVLVHGSGPVGLYAIAAARAFGARHVLCFGAPDARLEVATAFGADAVCNIEKTDAKQRLEVVRRYTEGRGADLSFECSGSHHALEETIGALRLGGRAVVIGAGDPQPAQIPGMAFIMKQITLMGVRSAGIEYYREALHFLATHKDRFPFERMFGATYGLHEIGHAMDKMHRLEEIKPVVDPFKVA
jgi:D-arabinose 1-dehydrogenase-like Zn-dependent alcohol dehydrogenase